MNPHIVMIQGTTSDAGKTVITAGLCRLLARQGRSVAPFKPQNMALNSAVTVEGGEIGRAQWLQAQACGIDASVHMNPILLKPSSDTRAQVIVQGKALHHQNADAFHDYKRQAKGFVLDSLQQLQSQYDQIVVEGAGSPAEINLREGDIANMGFAEAVDCPVILVADIDRGGVFAQLVGTLELLSPSEQDRIVGFIINRFRGDIALLQPGLDWLEQRTKKPVLAVMPYLPNFYLDAEDALSQTQRRSAAAKTVLRVRVPVIARISNHTDFDALRLHPNVDFEYVAVEDDPQGADLIILPGSKNTRADLAQLKAAGWQQHLERHLRYGGKVLGICGGYQMLGQSIADPEGIEGSVGDSDGFGLLPVSTQLLPDKHLRQVRGQLHGLNPQQAEPPVPFEGYEIHCGVSHIDDAEHRSPMVMSDGRSEGYLTHDGDILGTYVHGVWDSSAACERLLRWAGLESEAEKAVDLAALREQQLDRLADELGAQLDRETLAKHCPAWLE